MKIGWFIIPFLGILALNLVNFAAAEEQDEWYPFVLPAKMDPDSPANIGKLVLDPPAGKHGFCKVKDGHFYFEDGTRAKFWGTNLCFNACFPIKEQAEIIADRLAFFGFNAVRLHHMDFYFEPKGIFKDTNPESKDPQTKKTGELSEKQLGRLDYLIYQLKQRGIYVDMNLLVRRHFTLADGVVDADKLDGGAKPMSMFDPKLIGLQKQYAKDLFTHYNPYTKLRYCDDPAIALIEITNENSIFAFWKQDRLNAWSPYSLKSPIPAYYIKELDTLWNDWQKERYGTVKHASRPLYNALSLYPDSVRADIKAFYIELEKRYFTEMTAFLKTECGAKIPITGIGGYQCYEDVEAQGPCDFIDFHAYWDHPQFPNIQWDKNDFRIHNKSMLLDKNLGIIGRIKKHKPNNSKPYTITEWNHCYPNQYAYETPILLAAHAVKNDWDALFQFTFSHSLETKFVFDDIQDNFDAISNSQTLILCGAGSFIMHKAGYAKIAIENDIFKINSSRIAGFEGFIKGQILDLGPIIVKPRQNGAVFLYASDDKEIEKSKKLVLIIIGDVKNSNSYWRLERFEWGNAPVLLKSVGAPISVANKYKILAINNSGNLNATTQTAWYEIVSE